ncbi:MAG: hypothetical protein RMK94_14400 [Armatimonadota bacterium]|nr:hypothetical protein [Armatimonadota bacterium]
MMGLSDFLSKLLRVGIIIAAFLSFALVSFAPIAQQTSSPQPFPSAIILYPQPFEEIRDQTVFIVSMVSIPEEIADEYFLSSLFIFADDQWLEVYTLQDEMIYDPITRSYVGYYLSVWEGKIEGITLIGLQAIFGSQSTSSSIFCDFGHKVGKFDFEARRNKFTSPSSIVRVT